MPAMRPDYFLPKGFIKRKFNRTDGESEGLFSLTKFLKKMFERYKIGYVDDCCDIPTNEQTDLPIRYNKVAGKIQYYNPANDTWTNLSSF